MARAATTGAAEPTGGGVSIPIGVRCGLDRLLDRCEVLRGRSYGLLAHAAALTADLEPAHLALLRRGVPPRRLFGPEHGYHAVEQDMVPSADETEPWSGLPIRSLYGEDEGTLSPDRDALAGLDLLVVDLQDVGSRYYTFAATAIWAAQEALTAGLEVWVLDRPNPLGGLVIEGNVREPGFESFVGAFPWTVRHGLTLGELVILELGRVSGLEIWTMEGWRRSMLWPETGRPWIAPSPNMPTFATALLYPGLCLVEGTEVSEGRGTTRPFQLVGAPELDGPALAADLEQRRLPGVRFLPALFRPQFQKHAGEVCAGVELVVTDPSALAPFRVGVELVAALAERLGDAVWRRRAYEFVADRPAVDLLAGCASLRHGAARRPELDRWIASWAADEADFDARATTARLYPEEP